MKTKLHTSKPETSEVQEAKGGCLQQACSETDALDAAVRRITCATCGSKLFADGAQVWMRKGDVSAFWCSEECAENHNPHILTDGIITAMIARMTASKSPND